MIAVPEGSTIVFTLTDLKLTPMPTFTVRKATTGDKRHQVVNTQTGEIVRSFKYHRDADADARWLSEVHNRPPATIEELVAFATDTAGQW
jgi:hypothetical protein